MMLTPLLLFFILLVLMNIEDKNSSKKISGTNRWVNTKNTDINIQELNESMKPRKEREL